MENGQLVTRDGILPYDWNASTCYINRSDVTVLYGRGHNDPVEPEHGESTYEPFTSIRTLSLDGSILNIEGIGLIQGMDFTDPSKISQQLIFVDLDDPENTYAFDLQCIDSDDFTRNDGWDYTYTGFKAELDMKDNEIPRGSYYLKLKTINDDKDVESTLFCSMSAYRIMASYTESDSYLIRMNDYNGYRFEIDIIPFIEELDFTNINKPSKRSSNVSLDAIELNEEGDLKINGHSYMYYIDYDDPEKITYDLYLVDQGGNHLKLDTVLYDDGIDYKKELNSNYNINNISFIATGKIDELSEGSYVFYLKMSNTVDEIEYTDINEIKNYGFEVTPLVLNDKTFTISAGKIRKRLTLDVLGETN